MRDFGEQWDERRIAFTLMISKQDNVFTGCYLRVYRRPSCRMPHNRAVKVSQTTNVHICHLKVVIRRTYGSMIRREFIRCAEKLSSVCLDHVLENISCCPGSNIV